jgi:hypothetical protein
LDFSHFQLHSRLSGGDAAKPGTGVPQDLAAIKIFELE